MWEGLPFLRWQNIWCDFTYIITATVNEPDFGTIEPAGETMVEEGSSITYTITPHENYKVENLLVNGISQGELTTYTFENIQSNGTIHVIFVEDVGISENEFANIIVYSHLNTIYIKTVETGRAPSLPTIEILDMTGRVIYQNAITNNETAITLSVAAGIYAVKLISQEGKMAVRKVAVMR